MKMNRCRYCNKELLNSNSGGLVVCECSYANQEWSLGMKIQGIKSELAIATKELSDLKDNYSQSVHLGNKGDEK